jgi:hypothetical protein
MATFVGYDTPVRCGTASYTIFMDATLDPERFYIGLGQVGVHLDIRNRHNVTLRQVTEA